MKGHFTPTKDNLMITGSQDFVTRVGGHGWRFCKVLARQGRSLTG